jgi:hypothetical protein
MIALVAFALGLALVRARGSRPVGLPRLLACLVVAVFLAASVLKDHFGIIDFAAGALCGAMVCVPGVQALQKPRRLEWSLVAMCIVLGPLLGLAMVGIFELCGLIAAIDRMYYVSVFLIVGSCAGLVCALIASILVVLSPRKAEQSLAAESR